MRPLLLLLALAGAVRAEEIAFTRVNVVPMDSERVLRDATVVVRDGRIVAVGEVDPPEGARKIDGAGLTLMPGLCDMHVHLWYEEEHTLCLANGVTTVRNLWGVPKHLLWQEEIRAGRRLGPNLYTTGPILDGAPPIWEKSEVLKTPEEARRVVARLAAEGYRELKVYNRLRADVYAALVAAARKAGLRVAGHVPYAVGIEAALAAQQDSIEHLEGYYGQRWVFEQEKHAALARRTAEAGTWNCPTIVVYQMFVPADERARMLAQPHMRYVPPRLRATWDPSKDFRLKGMTAGRFRWLQRHLEDRMATLKLLHEAGARLMLGTDAGNPFVVAGWAVHLELKNMVAAGLSPYEALATATRNPAEYLGEPFGTVAVGQRADLLLVRGNPLEDVAAAERIVGVMVRGRWLPRAELDRRLEEIAASYGKPKRRFAALPPLPEGDTYRFEITWNGLVVGEERFVARRHGDGSLTLVGQEVNDPPWDETRSYSLTCDAAGRLTRLRAVRRDFRGRHVLRHGRGDAHYSSLAGWTATARRFRGLEVGAGLSFSYRELDDAEGSVAMPTTVQRDGDQSFVVTMQREDGTFTTRFLFDEQGVPLSMRTELQQGIVEKRRVGAAAPPR